MREVSPFFTRVCNGIPYANGILSLAWDNLKIVGDFGVAVDPERAAVIDGCVLWEVEVCRAEHITLVAVAARWGF